MSGSAYHGASVTVAETPNILLLRRRVGAAYSIVAAAGRRSHALRGGGSGSGAGRKFTVRMLVDPLMGSQPFGPGSARPASLTSDCGRASASMFMLRWASIVVGEGLIYNQPVVLLRSCTGGTDAARHALFTRGGGLVGVNFPWLI